MNVLHISQTDAGGGSARSAFRIHRGLKELGLASRMLVGDKRTDDPDIRPLKRSLSWRAIDRGFGLVADRLGLQYLLYPSSFGVASDPWFRGAQVVQLYNLHGSYFSHTALPFLSRRRPIVWRLSDMWALTGHVAYSYDCERWRLGCGSCPYLAEYPALPRDTTALLWRVKHAVYARSRLTIVAPSRWLGRLARESPLLGRFPVHHVPNGIDLDRFRPVAKDEARRRLDLDPSRPVVLLSALRLDEPRKGGAVLSQALGHLADVDFDLLAVGAGDVAVERPLRALGAVSDDETMALAYSAADLLVLPTLAENVPNAALESLACGTPCVAFDVGGVSDAVRHLETGYLASPGDAAALAEGVRTLLRDDELRARLAASCRRLAEREFSSERESRRYAELYEEALSTR